MRSLSIVLLLVTAVVAAPASAEWIEPEASYSGLRVMRSAGMEMRGRIYHDSGKERWEMSSQGMRQVMIRRPDQQRLLMILPDMNMGMEMKPDQMTGMPNPARYGEREPEEVGREEVGGEMTTKYRLVENAGGAPFTLFFWVTDDGIPLRMEGSGAEGGFEMILTELERGPQDPALFEPPAGLRIMPANPAMLGGMTGAMPQ